MKKQHKQLLRKLEKQGWDIHYTGGGHYKLINPDNNQMVVCGSTPCSGKRTQLNLISKLRRAGADL